MAKFHEGQYVEVKTGHWDKHAPMNSRDIWRPAQIDTFEFGPLLRSDGCYCVRFLDGSIGVFDAGSIRAAQP